jgi:hypothetical protein
MIIYVLKNEAGEYLCYDRDYGMTYVDKSFLRADHYYDLEYTKLESRGYRTLGKFSVHRWTITEEKDEK